MMAGAARSPRGAPEGLQPDAVPFALREVQRLALNDVRRPILGVVHPIALAEEHRFVDEDAADPEVLLRIGGHAEPLPKVERSLAHDLERRCPVRDPVDLPGNGYRQDGKCAKYPNPACAPSAQSRRV
jgi:hypothetical protein